MKPVNSKMTKFIGGVALFFLAWVTAVAQDRRAEVFLGYSYARINPNTPGQPISLVADFGGYHIAKIGDAQADVNFFGFLFGPRISYRRDARITPPNQFESSSQTHDKRVNFLTKMPLECFIGAPSSPNLGHRLLARWVITGMMCNCAEAGKNQTECAQKWAASLEFVANWGLSPSSRMVQTARELLSILASLTWTIPEYWQAFDVRFTANSWRRVWRQLSRDLRSVRSPKSG